MKKIIIGILLGGISFYLASVLSWAVIPWHKPVIKTLPEELLISDTLKVVVPEAGLYAFPSMGTDSKEYSDKSLKGPNGIIVFSPEGSLPITSKRTIFALLESFGTSAFVMMILILARNKTPTYGCRVFLSISIGVFAWFNTYVPLWNWFWFPLPYIGVALLDNLLAFSLMGLVLAKFVPEGN